MAQRPASARSIGTESRPLRSRSGPHDRPRHPDTGNENHRQRSIHAPARSAVFPQPLPGAEIPYGHSCPVFGPGFFVLSPTFSSLRSDNFRPFFLSSDTGYARNRRLAGVRSSAVRPLRGLPSLHSHVHSPLNHSAMKKLSLCLFACCSLLLALTACNGDNPSPVNYTLSLDRPTLGLQVGESFRLVATLTPAAEGGAPFVWTSDNEPVATVTDGLVEAAPSAQPPSPSAGRMRRRPTPGHGQRKRRGRHRHRARPDGPHPRNRRQPHPYRHRKTRRCDRQNRRMELLRPDNCLGKRRRRCGARPG